MIYNYTMGFLYEVFAVVIIVLKLTINTQWAWQWVLMPLWLPVIIIGILFNVSIIKKMIDFLK